MKQLPFSKTICKLVIAPCERKASLHMGTSVFSFVFVLVFMFVIIYLSVFISSGQFVLIFVYFFHSLWLFTSLPNFFMKLKLI